MKIILCLLSLFISFGSLADAKLLLQQRLAKVEGFSATFTQKVTTGDNDLIQEGTGELRVNRPSYFNWTMNEPDQTVILSDGQDLWMYVKEVEQVTVMSLTQAVDNSLLLLMTGSDSAPWQNYRVSRQENRFTLDPLNDNTQHFALTVLPTGMIANFTIIETDGQQSHYELSRQQLGKIDNKYFYFTVPNNVTVDDQR